MAHRTRDYAGKVYAEGRGTVHIHSTNKQFPAILTDLVDEQTRVQEHLQLPQQADYLVGRAALSTVKERAAARLGAYAIVLPEQGAWLANRIRTTTDNGSDVVVVVFNRADIY